MDCRHRAVGRFFTCSLSTSRGTCPSSTPGTRRLRTNSRRQIGRFDDRGLAGFKVVAIPVIGQKEDCFVTETHVGNATSPAYISRSCLNPSDILSSGKILKRISPKGNARSRIDTHRKKNSNSDHDGSSVKRRWANTYSTRAASRNLCMRSSIAESERPRSPSSPKLPMVKLAMTVPHASAC